MPRMPVRAARRPRNAADSAFSDESRYVTALEVAAIERALAKRGGALPARSGALPLLRNGGGGGERTCPLLNANGRCAVYADRSFGCRTFFCDRALLGSVPSRRELTSFVNRLRDPASAYQPNGDMPRALSNVFRSSKSR